MLESSTSTPSAGAFDSDPDLHAFQDALFRAYAEFCECLNYAPATASGYEAAVRGALDDVGVEYVWQLTPEYVRHYNTVLIARGVRTSTRQHYCGAIRSVVDFLITEHQHPIATRTGVVLHQAVTRQNAPRSRYCESYARRAPPTISTIRTLTRRLREGLPTAKRFEVAARDVALFEVLYLTAIRSNELRSLDVDDVYPRKGTEGQLHVRIGKGAKGSGPRARWIPLFDGLDDLLAWYLRAVRPKLKHRRSERALFLSTDTGGRLTYVGIDQILERCLKRACIPKSKRFTLHRVRHARATHLFESGMNLVAIQKLLGHEFITTTQKYVHVDASFVAKAHREMVQRTLQCKQR